MTVCIYHACNTWYFSLLSRVQDRWYVMCPRRWSAWVHVAWAAASLRPVSCRMQSQLPHWSAGQVSMLGGLGQIAAAEPAAAVRPPPPVSGGNRPALLQVDNTVRIETDPKCLPCCTLFFFCLEFWTCVSVKMGVGCSSTILKTFILMYNMCSTVSNEKTHRAHFLPVLKYFAN